MTRETLRSRHRSRGRYAAQFASAPPADATPLESAALSCPHAGVAELVDAPGLGPGGRSPWRFESSRPHSPERGCPRRLDSGQSCGVDVAIALPTNFSGADQSELVLVSAAQVARAARSLLGRWKSCATGRRHGARVRRRRADGGLVLQRRGDARPASALPAREPDELGQRQTRHRLRGSRRDRDATPGISGPEREPASAVSFAGE